MSRSTTTQYQPSVHTYPSTPAINDQIRILIRSFEDNDAFHLVKWVSYDGGNGSIQVRMSLGTGGNRLRLIAQEMRELWDVMGRIIEPHEWEKNLRYIPCHRLRSWAAMVVWWDRHEIARTPEVRKAWQKFIDKYENPYVSTPAEAIAAAKHYLMPEEIRQIRQQGRFKRGVFQNKLREDRAARIIYTAEEAKLNQALTEIGFKKGS